MTASIHPLPSRPEPALVIESHQLYECPAFRCKLSVAACQRNRKISQAKRLPSSAKGLGWKGMFGGRSGRVDAMYRDRIKRCAGCPGVLALARGERPVPQPVRAPEPERKLGRHRDPDEIVQQARRLYYLENWSRPRLMARYNCSRTKMGSMLYGIKAYADVEFEPEVAAVRETYGRGGRHPKSERQS